MPLVDSSDRKIGGFGGVGECSATFLVAVVLDPWACTAGRFFDCGDEIEPKVWVEEESFGTRGGCIFGGFWRIADTADLVGFWWMENLRMPGGFTAGGLADSAISGLEAAGIGIVADNLVAVDDSPV